MVASIRRPCIIAVAVALAAALVLGAWLYLASRPLTCAEWREKAREFERTDAAILGDPGLNAPELDEEEHVRARAKLRELLRTQPEGCEV